MDNHYAICKRMYDAGLDHAWYSTDEVWYCAAAPCPRPVGFPVPSGVIWCPRVGDVIAALGDDLVCIRPHLSGGVFSWLVYYRLSVCSDNDLWLALCAAWLAIHEQTKPAPVKLPWAWYNNIGEHELGSRWNRRYSHGNDEAAKRPFPRHDQTPPVDSAVNQPDLVMPYPWADGVDLMGGLVVTDNGRTFICTGQLRDRLYHEKGSVFIGHCRPAPRAFKVGDRVRVVSNRHAPYLRCGWGGEIVATEPVSKWFIIRHPDGPVYSETTVHSADLLYIPPSPPVPKYSVDSWLLKGSTAGRVLHVRINQKIDNRVVPVVYEVKIPNGPAWMRPATGYWAEDEVTLIGGAK